MLRFLLIFLLTSVFSAYAQKSLKSKSIENLMIEKLNKNKNNNDTLYFYSKKLQNSKNSCSKYSGVVYEALYHYRKNDFKKSEMLCKKTVENLTNEIDYCSRKISFDAYNRLFWINKNQNKFLLAYHNLIEMDKILRVILNKDNYKKDLYYSIQINIASIKSLLGYNKEAKDILKKSIEYYKNRDVKNEHTSYSKIQNQSSAYNLIAEFFLNDAKSKNSTDLDSASFYFKKAYDIAKQFDPKHENSETLFQLREANVLLAREEYEKSLEIINKYSKNQKKFNTSQNINSLKAICFHHLNNSDSALVYAKKYLKNYRSKEINKRKLITIYDILANQYHIKQKLDSAFKYSELTLSEIKLLERNKNNVNKTHFLYNKKNIEDLNKKILEKERFDYQKLIGFIIIFTLLIIVFFVRKSKKTTTHLSKVEKFDQQIVNPTAKKEYNINIEIEDSILQGLKDLKNSSNFLKSDFNIKILADELNTNTTYISYVINKKFQKSFKEYLTEIRIEYLINKLEKEKDHKKYTIKFLGEQIGYTNASAFTRAFKKYKGITPSEFIKNLG